MHGPGQQAGGLPVAFALADGRDDGSGALDGVVAVGVVEVFALEGCGGGQDDVGVAGGVCEEALVDDGEEVFALEAAQDLVLVGGGAGGIGGIDVERLDGRFECIVIERAAELAHVDVANASLLEVGAADDVLVEGVAAGGGGQETAAFLGVGADEGGQAGDEARGHGAVDVAGLAAAEADEGGAGIAVGMGEGADIRGGDAGDSCGGFGGVVRQDLLLEFVRSLHVLLEEGAVGEAVAHEHAEDGKRECTVGAGARAEEGVGVVGGPRAVGVDAVNLGAIPAGNLDVVTEVDVGREHADAPEDDHVAVLGFLRGGRQRCAHDIAVAAALGRCADGAVKTRGTECVEESMAGAVANRAHRAGIGIGQDGLGAVVMDDGLPAPGNLGDGFIPTDGGKASFALSARAL